MTKMFSMNDERLAGAEGAGGWAERSEGLRATRLVL